MLLLKEHTAQSQMMKTPNSSENGQKWWIKKSNMLKKKIHQNNLGGGGGGGESPEHLQKATNKYKYSIYTHKKTPKQMNIPNILFKYSKKWHWTFF